MSDPIIQFDHFSFQYRAQAESTLHDITLSIRKGEKVLICGPSGCGKSTLGHCINGLIPHSYRGESTGRVTVRGRSTAELNIVEISHTVGTVLQDTDGQFIGLTVGSRDKAPFAGQIGFIPVAEIQGRRDIFRKHRGVHRGRQGNIFQCPHGHGREGGTASQQQKKAEQHQAEQAFHRASPSFPFRGRVTVKVEPCPGMLSTVISPWCRLTS